MTRKSQEKWQKILNNSNIAIGLFLYFLSHIIIWFQVNGQFIWPWAKDNPWVMAILTWYMLGEGINLKTMTSLILATGLVCVQVFWKV